jgi:hypothetical protein
MQGSPCVNEQVAHSINPREYGKYTLRYQISQKMQV